MHKKLTLYFLTGSLVLNSIGVYAVENSHFNKIGKESQEALASQENSLLDTEANKVPEVEGQQDTALNIKADNNDGQQVGTKEEAPGEVLPEGDVNSEEKAEGTGTPEGETEGTGTLEGEIEGTGTPEGETEGTGTLEGEIEGNVNPEGEAEGNVNPEGESEDNISPEGETEGEANPEEESLEDLIGSTEDISNKAFFKVGSKEVMLFGEKVILNIPPQVIDGRTLLPLRFIGEELLGADVYYNQETKKITVRKEALTVELAIGSKIAYVNGHEVMMDTMPVVQQGTTLLPLRFLAEQFELGIDYDSTTKIIKVEKPVEIPNIPPTATFTFKEETYTVGQVIEADVETFDADGHEIVAQRWMLNHKSGQIYNSLEALSKALQPDYVAISVQVQDERGLWSEWYTEYIIIKPNSEPVITHLEGTKDEYAQGEDIELEFEYVNEDFEGIKAEKWSYRKVGEQLNQSILEKPKAIYSKGEYIVTLELQDDAGNWSSKKEAIIEVTGEVMESEFENIFKNGKPGDIITNFQGTNFRSYHDVDYIEEDEQGTLIMSNSPEVVKENGILYEEYVEGEGRMMFHHINEFNSTQKKKLMVLVENQGEEVVQGKLINEVVKGPSSDVLFVGQQLLHDYLGANHTKSMMIMPGETKVIYDSSSKNWLNKQAISGMFEFDFDKEVKITVVAMDVNDPIEMIEFLGYPARDIHPRGTFDVINKDITINLEDQDGPSKILIGQGENEWLVGTDGITGEVVMNKGNFGVEYHITVRADEDTAVILNPRGNMYKGSIKWNGMDPFMTPKSGYFPDAKRAAFLGVLKAGISRTFTYILPNGSSAPVLIGFIPKSEWN